MKLAAQKGFKECIILSCMLKRDHQRKEGVYRFSTKSSFWSRGRFVLLFQRLKDRSLRSRKSSLASASRISDTTRVQNWALKTTSQPPPRNQPLGAAPPLTRRPSEPAPVPSQPLQQLSFCAPPGHGFGPSKMSRRRPSQLCLLSRAGDERPYRAQHTASATAPASSSDTQGEALRPERPSVRTAACLKWACASEDQLQGTHWVGSGPSPWVEGSKLSSAP